MAPIPLWLCCGRGLILSAYSCLLGHDLSTQVSFCEQLMIHGQALHLRLRGLLLTEAG